MTRPVPVPVSTPAEAPRFAGRRGQRAGRPGAPSPGASPAVFAVTALGAFMASLDLSIVNVAFPSLLHSFPSASTAAVSWVITAYAIVFAALLVTAGRTADRLGRRRVFLAGLTLFTVGSAGCGLAPNVAALVVGRAVQAVGAALLVPASLGLLLADVPLQRRAQTVALWGGVGALAVATGPSLGALLVQAGGWRWAFLVNLPVALVAFLAGQRVLAADAPAQHTGRPDYLGVVIVTAAMAFLVLAISQGPAWGWGDARVLAGLVLAVALTPVFVQRSRRHREPALDLTLFRARSFAVANIATFAYAVGFFAMLLGNILFLTAVWRYSILRAGLAVTPGPLVVAVVSGPAGRAAGRVGARRVLLPGLGTFAAGLLWFVLRVGEAPSYLAQWLPGTLVVGLGIGLSFPVLAAVAVSELPAHRYAVGSAVNQTARQLGGAVGIAVLVAILGSSSGVGTQLSHYHWLWLVAASCAAVAAAVVTRLDATSARRPVGRLVAPDPELRPAREPEPGRPRVARGR